MHTRLPPFDIALCDLGKPKLLPLMVYLSIENQEKPNFTPPNLVAHNLLWLFSYVLFHHSPNKIIPKNSTSIG